MMKSPKEMQRYNLIGAARALGAGQAGVTVTFWPMTETVFTGSTIAAFSDSLVSGLGSQALTLRDGSGTATALSTLTPIKTATDVSIYKMTGATYGFTCPDHADNTMGDGSVDSPFSLLCWLSADTIPVGASGRIIFYKRLWTAGTGEYTWHMRSNRSDMYVLLKDQSAGAVEDNDFAGVVAADLLHPCCIAYDGDETNPSINLYRGDPTRFEGIQNPDLFMSVGDTENTTGNTAESGTYTAMEDTSTFLGVGCATDNATTGAVISASVWLGNFTMPAVVKGKQLTEAEFVRWVKYTRALLTGQ